MLCPPLRRTEQPNFLEIFLAAVSISSSEETDIWARTSASGMFGVITVASPSNSLFNTSTASSLISLAPLVATITGSITIFLSEYCLIDEAITLISSAEETIPIFTASGKMSVTTASICFCRNCGVTSIMPVTPRVF